MVTVIMLCGVCGSGKTTYAKQKEKEGFVRLSIDEEMWKKYGQCGIDYPQNQYDKLSEKVEQILCDRLIQLIKSGQNVVIDFSFWDKKRRGKYTKIITDLNAKRELVYLKATKELLKIRLFERNKSIHANSPFEITDEILDHHFDGFQEPQGEGELVILQS